MLRLVEEYSMEVRRVVEYLSEEPVAETKKNKKTIIFKKQLGYFDPQVNRLSHMYTHK